MKNQSKENRRSTARSWGELSRRLSLWAVLGLVVGSETSLTAAPDASKLRQQASALISPIPEKMPGSEQDTKPFRVKV